MWMGSENELRHVLGPTKCSILDLLDLFDPNKLPAGDEATGEQLRDNLCLHLRSIQHGPDNRVILMVKSIGLLARYTIGINAFYDWFIGDFTLVILLLDVGMEKVEWPEEVRCEASRLSGYFLELGMVKDVFSTTG